MIVFIGLILMLLVIIIEYLANEGLRYRPSRYSGRGEGPIEISQRGDDLGRAMHEVAFAEAHSAFGGVEDEARTKNKKSKSKKDGKKTWRDCKTWKEIFANPTLERKYMKEHDRVFERFGLLDWIGVYKEVSAKCDDFREEREYIGSIDVVNGKLTLTGMEASSYAMGEGDLSDGKYAATIPTRLVKKYFDKPALFVFHTHPFTTDNTDAESFRTIHDPFSYLPSLPDLSSAATLSWQSMFCSSLIFSKYGITNMSWNPKVLAFADKQKNSYLEFLYATFSMLTTFSSFASSSIRSWRVSDLTEQVRKVGFNIFPLYATPMYSELNMYGFTLLQDKILDEEIMSSYLSEIHREEKKR